jgi:hypothetical protein
MLDAFTAEPAGFGKDNPAVTMLKRDPLSSFASRLFRFSIGSLRKSSPSNSSKSKSNEPLWRAHRFAVTARTVRSAFYSLIGFVGFDACWKSASIGRRYAPSVAL